MSLLLHVGAGSFILQQFRAESRHVHSSKSQSPAFMCFLLTILPLFSVLADALFVKENIFIQQRCIASTLVLCIVIIITTQVTILFKNNSYIIIACRNSHYNSCFGILDGEVVLEVGGVDASVAQFVKWGMHVMLPHVFPSHALFYFYVTVNLNVIIKVVVSVILSFTSEHNARLLKFSYHNGP